MSVASSVTEPTSFSDSIHFIIVIAVLSLIIIVLFAVVSRQYVKIRRTSLYVPPREFKLESLA